MRDLPAGPSGERLGVDAYYRDFEPRFWNIKKHDFWKLERRQSFQEDGSPSWDAFSRGDWAEALRLMAGRRQSLSDYYNRVAQNGFSTYRVRVVAEPITPYLQWELNSLLQRAECGERVRIVGDGDIATFEREVELPEIVTVGSEAMYQVIYNDAGALEGAICSTNPGEVAAWREFIEHLYAEGEEIGNFHKRKVARLQPPRVR
ncbi:MAG: DUF6879 family protein [Actinomadura sp.]